MIRNISLGLGITLFSLACFVFVSCNDDLDDALIEIYTLSGTNKEKALALADSLQSFRVSFSDLQKNKLIVYSTLIRDKNYNDIANDSLIFSAVDYFKNVGDYFHLGLAYMYAGRVLDAQENDDHAYEYYLKAEKILNKTEHNNLKGTLLYFMGNQCGLQKSYDKALNRYKEALYCLNRVADSTLVYEIYNNMGLCYAFKGDLDNAVANYQHSIDIAKIAQKNEWKFNSYINLGIVYHSFEETVSSKKNFLLALKSATTHIDSCRVYLALADMLLHSENDSSAVKYMELAQSKINNTQIEDKKLQTELLLMRSQYSEMNRDYKTALKFYKDYSRIATEVYEENISGELTELEKKYEKSELEKEKADYTVKARNFQLLTVLVMVVAAVFFVLWKHNIIKGKQKEQELKNQIDEIQAYAHSVQANEKNKDDEAVQIMTKYFNILKKAALLKEHIREDTKLTGSKLFKVVNKIVYGKDSFNWEDFIAAKNKIDNDCFKKLEHLYPELTETEFKICCLTYCKLDNIAISLIMGLSENTIKTRKQQIRKKLNIENKYSSFFEELNKLINR